MDIYLVEGDRKGERIQAKVEGNRVTFELIKLITDEGGQATNSKVALMNLSKRSLIRVSDIIRRTENRRGRPAYIEEPSQISVTDTIL